MAVKQHETLEEWSYSYRSGMSTYLLVGLFGCTIGSRFVNGHGSQSDSLLCCFLRLSATTFTTASTDPEVSIVCSTHFTM
jgi:hypothetical protein